MASTETSETVTPPPRSVPPLEKQKKKPELCHMGTRRFRYKRPRKQDLHRKLQNKTSASKVHPQNKKSWRHRKEPTVSSINVDALEKDMASAENMDRPWSAPNEEMAMRLRKQSMFGDGTASFTETRVEDFDLVGFGVVMYFKMLKFLFYAFLVMSVFASITIWICQQGSQIDDNDDFESKDFLTKSTVANIGSNAHAIDVIDATHFDFSKCGQTYALFDVNGTETGETSILDCKDTTRIPSQTFSVFEFEEWSQPIWEVAYQITILDVLYSAVFFALIVYLPGKLSKIRDALDAGYLSASDYAVYVTGLPESFDRNALRKHFSDLYDPTKLQSYEYESKRCCVPSRRPVSEDTKARYADLKRTKMYRPVQQTLDNMYVQGEERDCEYVGGWVTDVTLCLHNGEAINRLRSQLSIRKKIRTLLDTIRKYSEGTTYKGGANAKKADKLKKKLAVLKTKLVHKFQPILTAPASDAKRAESADLNEQSKICGAFVVFEHQESFRRCLKDYEDFDNALTRWRMPEPLMFQGHIISVRRAPEPSTILWENLQETTGRQCCRRTATFLATCVLLLGSLGAITAVTSMTLSKKKPELAYCGEDVMATYYRPRRMNKDTGTYDFESMFHDYEPDTWSTLNRTYGYDAVTADNDRCPMLYFELGVKNARRTDSTESLEIEYVTSTSVDDDAQGVLDNYTIVSDASLSTHALYRTVQEDVTRDMSARSKTTVVRHTYQVRVTATNASLTFSSTSTPTSPVHVFETSEVEWPRRKCAAGVGDACGNESSWVYDSDDFGDDCFRPCFNPLDDEAMCDTYACSGLDPNPSNMCNEFWSGTVPGCFCLDLQNARLGQDLGFVEYVRELYKLYDEYPICSSFGDMFSFGMDISKVFVVALINSIISFCVTKLADFELHESLSDKLASIMRRDFLARLLNTAFVILLVESAGIPGSELEDTGYTSEKRDATNPGAFETVYLFEGSLSGFTREWYDKLAFALTFQMLVNLIEPHLMCFVQWAFFSVYRSFVLMVSSTQDQVNRFYRGTSFQVHVRYSHVLHTIFFTMLYASAMPLIVPVCALNLALTFVIDKYMMLRFYNTDGLDGLNGSLALAAVKMLPFALILHLGFAVWIYSDSDTFYSNNWASAFPELVMWPSIGPGNETTVLGVMTFERETYSEWLRRYEEDGFGTFFVEDHLRLMPRVIRWNVFPVFVLLLIVVVFTMYEKIIEPVVDVVSSNVYHFFSIQCKSLFGSSAKVTPGDSRRERKKRRRMTRMRNRVKRQWAKVETPRIDDEDRSSLDNTLPDASKVDTKTEDRDDEVATSPSSKEQTGLNEVQKKVLEQQQTERQNAISLRDMKRRILEAGDQDGDGDADFFDLHYLEWRDLLVDFYEKYQSSQLPHVDQVLQRFRGREIELFKALESKYHHAPFNVYVSKAKKLYEVEAKELQAIVLTSDMVFEPPYTGLCRKPVMLGDELMFRKNLLNKYDENLGGWQRTPDTKPLETGIVYYRQVWDSEGAIAGIKHREGDEKRTWEVIHRYAPFTYDMGECERYHDVIDLSALLFMNSEGQSARKADKSEVNTTCTLSEDDSDTAITSSQDKYESKTDDELTAGPSESDVGVKSSQETEMPPIGNDEDDDPEILM